MKKERTLLFSLALLILFFSIKHSVVFADSGVNLTEIFGKDVKTDPKDIVKKIIKFLNISIMSVSVLGVMIGGLVMMTASGDDGQISKGKDILKYSIMGLIMTISAYLIVTFAQTILYSLGT